MQMIRPRSDGPKLSGPNRAHEIRSGKYIPWCEECPLRNGFHAVDFTPAELEFMKGFKRHHEVARAGEILIEQGGSAPRMMTLFSGWAAKFRSFRSGERQLLDVVLPGHLLGLESTLLGTSEHSVEALTDVSFCAFDPGRLGELLAVDGLAGRVAALQEIEKRHLSERLASVGASDGPSQLAHFVVDLFDRLDQRHLVRANSFALPLSQEQIGEALGMTATHVCRLLGRFRREQALSISDGRALVLDLEKLRITGRKPRSIDRETDLLL